MIKKLLFCEGQYCFINDVDIPFIPILTLYRKKSVFSYLASLRDTPHTPTNPYYHLFTNSEEKIVSNSFDFLSSLLHWVQNRWNFRAIFIRSKDSTFFLSFKFEDFKKFWGYQLCWLHYTKHWMKKCGKTKKTFCLFLLDNLTAYVYGPRCSHLHTVSNSWRFCSRTLVLRPKHACLRLKIKADLLWTFKFRTIRIKNLFILLVGPKQ